LIWIKLLLKQWGRAATLGLDNVNFHRADLLTFLDTEPFDAIIGRLVLEFVPDTAAAIKRLCMLLRPGGIMAFQEPSWRIWYQMSCAHFSSFHFSVIGLFLPLGIQSG
jgi:trans-aconitate methyltransferase